MPHPVYISISEINELQEKIMYFVDSWAREKRTVIPFREIIIFMKKSGTSEPTTRNAINALVRKKYIRRAVTSSNKTFFVQLRKV